MRSKLALSACAALLFIAGCSDPESIVEPYASQVAYEFTRNEVDNAGGWLEIAEIGNDTSLELTPAVSVWGDGAADVDEDGDGPEGPVTHWETLEESDWALDLANGRVFIDLADESRHFRVVVTRSSSEL